MITNEEAEELYSKLLELLRRTNFAYVADQVEEYVGLGHLEKKDVDVSTAVLIGTTEVPLNARRRGKRRTEVFIENVDFTPLEKVEQLVRALERVTVEISELHSATSRNLQDTIHAGVSSDSEPAPVTFQFIAESGDTKIISSIAQRENLTRESSQLEGLLKEVKELCRAD